MPMSGDLILRLWRRNEMLDLIDVLKQRRQHLGLRDTYTFTESAQQHGHIVLNSADLKKKGNADG